MNQHIAIMKKSFIYLILFYSIVIQLDVRAQQTIEIQEGTVIKVRLLETLDSKTAKNGDIVTLETLDKIEIGGKKVIDFNARATGRVINSVSNKSMGRKGKLEISIDYVKAVDGTNVPLSYTMNQSGKDATVGVIAGAVLLSPLALVVKGKSAVILKGAEFNTYVARSTKIDLP